MSVNCHICKGQMKEVKTEINSGWKDYDLVIRGVNALECNECGEKIFHTKDVRMIQKFSYVLSEMDEKTDILNVEEVADMLRVSEQTIYNMTKKQ